jgi:hypothetical protein
MRLPAEVAGSLSRLQGLLMAAEPEIQRSYATHWLAMREAGEVPAFQQMTQHLLWGLYGTTALRGLLREALSGRANPVVLAGIIDQLNLIQHSYRQAAAALGTFLALPEAREFDYVPAMVRSFEPLDRVYQAVQQPAQVITGTLRWVPGRPLSQVGVRIANLERRSEGLSEETQ